MNKKNVVVLYGGCSPEHEISVQSAKNIIYSLSAENYNVIPVYITKDGSWVMCDNYKHSLDDLQNRIKYLEQFNDEWEVIGSSVMIGPDRAYKSLLRLVRDKIKRIPIDIVIPVLHGIFGEDGSIQGLLEIANIPYVGCGILSSSICLDKSYLYKIADSIKLNQAKYIVINEFEKDDKKILRSIATKLGFPCFVKPCKTGSSIGITKVKDKTQLLQAMDIAFKFDSRVIIEQAIVGRELECSVLGDSELPDNIEVSIIGEIKPSNEFYDYKAKYESGSELIIPAELSEDISNEIRSCAIEIFKAVGGSGCARVDFFLEQDTNKIFFNEINTFPGFTNISMYPKLWNYCGIDTSLLLDKLINIAFEKFERNNICIK